MNDLLIDVWSNVLKYITDPRDLSNCRKTCKLFNQHLSENCKYITESNRPFKSEVDQYWPPLSRNHSITMKFLLTFSKIKILNFPVFVENYQELSVIIMMKNLSKATIRLSSKFDPNLLLQFVKDYKSGYVLSNGFFIKEERNLENKVFKFIRKNTVRYIREGMYGLINTDHPRQMTLLDLSLIKELGAKTIITNSVRHRITDTLDVNRVIHPYECDSIHFDHNPWGRCKEYICVPYKGKNRNQDSALMYEFELDELRPNIESYIVPVLFIQIVKMIEMFPNINNVGVYLNEDKYIPILEQFSHKLGLNIQIYHNNLDIPLSQNISEFNLSKLESLEETVDGIFR